jgi:hypothetical protein
MKETELIAAANGMLTERGCQMFPEVKIGGDTADLIALKRDQDGRARLSVWEGKVGFTFEVMHQALRWNDRADYSGIIIPSAKNSRARDLGLALTVKLGLGIIEVHNGKAELLEPPKFNDISNLEILSKLTPAREAFDREHRVQAGNSTGNRFTPWRQTIANLVAWVHKNPGLAFKYAIADIDHHYENDHKARLELGKRLDQIEGIEVRIQGGIRHLYPEEDR